ncbi:hypothetical protein [Gracilibacillus suaedae]|uniref:hypothetical protein n=1 Tax=Gracilibacillus suaedae TaxID=2820273 RepID=UPI001ABE1440|nr:hypothetical protein [Gracilibacillus suaedae]
MFNILFPFLIGFAIFLSQFTGFKTKWNNKERAIYILLLIVGVTLYQLELNDITIPRFFEVIISIFEPISTRLKQYLDQHFA